jgi:hypothetical protein
MAGWAAISAPTNTADWSALAPSKFTLAIEKKSSLGTGRLLLGPGAGSCPYSLVEYNCAFGDIGLFLQPCSIVATMGRLPIRSRVHPAQIISE